MEAVLNIIGMAKKAGRLEVGEEPVGAVARAHKARLLMLASDAAENTVRRVEHYAQVGNASCVTLPCTKAEMGMIIGRTSCAVMAFTDAGFAASLTKKLAAAQPGTIDEVAQALDAKAAKVLKRQKEMRQHEKNLQRAKAKPWAK